MTPGLEQTAGHIVVSKIGVGQDFPDQRDTADWFVVGIVGALLSESV